MKKVHRVFAYGTLKSGKYFHNEYLGGDKSNFLGTAKASLDYSMYIDGLPHLVKESTDKPVQGELYEVDEAVLASLDKLEGHPVYYRREIIEVFDDQNERKLAWAYIRNVNFKGKSGVFKEENFE
jgi:gamma-glutamylaminecyclotransferase